MEVVNETPAIDPSKVPLCLCVDSDGQKYTYAVVKISKTEKNPGREFFSCHLSKANGGCGFFAFADEIYTDPKTGLARRKYVKRENSTASTEQKSLTNQLEQRLSSLEFSFEDIKQRLKILEERITTEENELLASKSQKTTGAARGKPRAKILP